MFLTNVLKIVLICVVNHFLYASLPVLASSMECPDACDCFMDAASRLTVTCTSDNIPLEIPLSVQNLTIINAKYDILPPGLFVRYAHMEALTFAHSCINIMNNNSFIGLIRLQTWTVRQDHCLAVLHSAVFWPLKEIKSIHFNNVNINISEISKSFTGLKGGTVDEITIKYTQITTLGQEFFIPLAATNITKLDLSYNYIRYLEPGFSSFVPKLTAFVLHTNALNNLENVLEMLRFRSLRSLEISYEDVFFFSYEGLPSLFKTFMSHITLNISSQQYSDPYCSSACLSKECIHIQTNSIETIHARRFLSPTIFCNVYHSMFFERPNRIYEIDVSLNQFDEISSYLCGLDNLESLNIADNGCSYLPPGYFSTFPKLRMLSIASNSLAGIVDHSSFSTKNNITSLDLSQNGFNDSTISFINSMGALQSLTVRQNHLSKLDISRLPNLNYLDISFNKLQFSMTFLTDLDSVSKSHDITVDLSENPLTSTQSCCDIISFIKWIGITHVHLKNVPKYACILQNKRKHINAISLPMLSKVCVPNKSVDKVTFIAVLFSIFCLTTLVVSLLFRGRWTVRWWMYMFRRFFKIKEQIRNSRNYKYDAFIAYSGDDVMWVRQELIPRLEEENHFTLCIHERDFTPGIPIEENIVMAMLESRKAILLINDNFLSSNYCHFEVQMARQKLFDDNDDIIIPVILEPFNWDKMTHTLRNILRQNTYIEWSDDGRGRTLFWRKLIDSLSLYRCDSYSLNYLHLLDE